MTTNLKTLIDNATENMATSVYDVGESEYTESKKGAKLPNELLLKALEALEAISVDFGTDYCDGNCLNAYKTLNEIRKRLIEAGK